MARSIWAERAEKVVCGKSGGVSLHPPPLAENDLPGVGVGGVGAGDFPPLFFFPLMRAWSRSRVRALDALMLSASVRE